MQKTIEKEESDDEDEGARDKGSGMVYDFDIMMQKKKAERCYVHFRVIYIR